MKYFIALLLLIAAAYEVHSQACCCTGAGANYSILPNLNKHVVGLRYTYRNYFSETTSLNPELDGGITNQQLNTVELFGRFNVINQLQLSVFMPVSFIQQQTKESKSFVAGLGDMSLLLQYNVLNPLRCNGKKSKHQLRLGVGVKLPSGDFSMNSSDMFNTNLQLGTGSVDFPFNAIYTYRIQNFGLNAIAGYRLNTANTKAYRFGNRVQAALNLFYIFDIKQVQLMPTAGVNYEYQCNNRMSGKILKYTGGHFITASMGFDIYYKQFAFSASLSPAVMNRLNWSGETQNRFNAEAGFFYNFSTNKNKK